MLTVHIGRIVPRSPLPFGSDAVVTVLADGRAQMRARQLEPGDIIEGLGVVDRIERLREAA